MRMYFLFAISIFLIVSCQKSSPIEIPIVDDTNLSIDTLFIGGNFTISDSIQANNIAMWDGTRWLSLGEGITGHSAEVECMAVFRGDLYVGGFLDTAGNTHAKNIAKWDGKKWSAVGEGIDGRVTSLVVYQDELYAGGWFFNAGGMKADNIAKWNGASWSPVGKGFSDEVYTLTIHKGLLYAGGWFTKNYGEYVNANKVARWNGTIWDSVGLGIKGDIPGGSWVDILCSYNNDLFAFGNFSHSGNYNAHGMAKWNDTIWVPTDLNIIKPPEIYAAAEYKGELNIGGSFDSSATIQNPHYIVWNGSEWTSGRIQFDSTPDCFYVSNGYLFMGGSFNMANNQIVNKILKWDGATISTFGSGIQGSVLSILEFKK